MPRCREKDYRNEWYRIDRQKNPEKYKKYDQNATIKKRTQKKRLIEHMGGKCSKCSGVFHPNCYDLHHLDPAEKERGISYVLFSSWEAILKEASKCVLLCANCHRELHALEMESQNA